MSSINRTVQTRKPFLIQGVEIRLLKNTMIVRIVKYTFLILIVGGLITWIGNVMGSNYSGGMLLPGFLPQSQPTTAISDSSDLIYPLEDHQGDFISNPNDNPFDFDDPSAVEQEVEYDPVTGTYTVTETIGGVPYRYPTTYTFDEFLEMSKDKSLTDYWQEKSSNSSLTSGSGLAPSFDLGNEVVDRIFGGSDVEIRPSGSIDMFFGVRRSITQNPVLTPFQQAPPAQFDFDMDINMNVVGNIGDRMTLKTNYNTLSSFNFNNELKLEYTGDEDEIIQRIEAGNVSFPLPTSLIPGAQSLWGLRTDLKFGRLKLSTVLSQQRSETKSLQIQNGALVQDFEVEADRYEENRHFFLNNYFRSNFNKALETMPYINSQVEITNLEVWVTNTRGETENIRDIVAFADLGERDPYAESLSPNPACPGVFPQNCSNDLFSNLKEHPSAPINRDQIVSVLETQFGLKDIQDFKKQQVRRLNPSEFTYDPKLGFLSLNFALKTTEVLAVSYEYTTIFSDQVYRVGEFSQDRAPVEGQEPVLYLKMLKSTSARPKHPIWDLMMKNIYNLGAYQIEPEDFRLDVYYKNPGSGDIRFMPEGESVRGIPLIRLLNLDRLNFQNDPRPDAIFDFVQGLTINTQNGRLMFPVLEPFGEDLKEKYDESEFEIADKYAYTELYDSTKVIAEQFLEKNRFTIKGTYKSSSSAVINLGAFNLPPNSVRVTANGKELIEGSDYSVDYNLGRVTILNEAYINSGAPVRVSFEDPSLFGLQTKTMIGARADYFVAKDFNLGATYMHLSQRPYTNKTNYGDDPISNRMVGIDGNYFTESRFLTKMVDRIPFIETKEPSSISANFEGAAFIPGHARAVDTDDGTVFIDDFEGAENDIFLNTPTNRWLLSSTPRSDLFPEAALNNEWAYNFNRARISWYQIFNLSAGGATVGNINASHYTRRVFEKDLFPNTTGSVGIDNPILPTFDVAYYPRERGPYNYDTTATAYSSGLSQNGELADPETRWGGIMRDLDYNDFEQSNIEFIEFWLLDPFIDNPNNGGDLYLNLGTMSEDILKDSKKFYENGLPGPGQPSVNISETEWGRVPISPQITNGFANDLEARTRQDVGYDGLDDQGEVEKFERYINWVSGGNISDSEFITNTLQDPSADNYQYFLDESLGDLPPLERYKYFTNPEGNSPIQSGDARITTAYTTYPDNEDINQDNNLEESEEYFQYHIPLSKVDLEDPFNTYIRDKIVIPASEIEGLDNDEVWYQFRIPVGNYTSKVGEIPDFRSIQFMRMFMTGFSEDVVLRFGRFNLIRNQWRKYQFDIREEGEYLPSDNFEDTFFNVSAVSVEENGSRYALPPGVIREQVIGTLNNNLLQNEQSLALNVCNLPDGYGRGVYKRVDMDMRHFGRLKMYIHAEEFEEIDGLEDGDITAFIRLGDDFQNNYYEYEIPLVISAEVASDQTGEDVVGELWKDVNNLDIVLQELVDLKLDRNLKNFDFADPYFRYKKVFAGVGIDSIEHRMTVVGSPTLGKVKQIMLGVRNPKRNNITINSDDGEPKCAELWFNELRLADFDESGGYAALARVDMKLADFGNINVSGNMHTAGFGNLEQRVTERFIDNYYEWGATGNFEMGKFFSQDAGVRLPLLASYTSSVSTPEYDPYDTDIQMKQLLDSIRVYNPDNAKEVVREERKMRQTTLTNKSINVTNAQIVQTDPTKKKRIYSPENLNATYAFNETEFTDHIIEKDKVRSHLGVLGYNYSARAKYITPFKKMIGSKSKYLKLFKDINFNLVPSSINWSTSLEKRDGELQLRQLRNDPFAIEPTYWRDYSWDLNYGFRHDLTRSIKIDYSSQYSSQIDTFSSKYAWNLSDRYSSRPINYNQTANVSYKIPLDKIPFLDWTQLRAKYGTGYTWTAGSVYMADSLGNYISNSQNLQLNAEFNFRNLFNKSKFLKKALSSSPSRPKPKKSKDDPKDPKADDPKKKKKNTNDVSPLVKLIRPIFSLQRLTLSFRETKSTDVPGYMFSTTPWLGVDWGNSQSPGSDLLGFVFGQQPNDAWLNNAVSTTPEEYWISNNILLNDKVNQNQQYNLTARASFEPIKDFKLDINFDASYGTTDNYYFKVDSSDMYRKLAPRTTGNYSISFLPLRTSFDKVIDYQVEGLDTIEVLKVPSPLLRFKAKYREQASQFLGEINGASNGEYFAPNDSVLTAMIEQGIVNYEDGYGPFSQDVLLPAFIAAYTDRDVDSKFVQKFNQYPFYNWAIPMPNWQLNYTGLSKLPMFKELFKSIKLSHGYSSTLSVNNFVTNPDFDFSNSPSPFERENNLLPSEYVNYYPGALNEDGNFYGYYRIPNLSITEAFAPLIGVDITWFNGLTTRFDYRKTRNLSLSLVSFQVIESNSKEYTFDLGYQVSGGLKLPFKFGGEEVTLPNDLTFRFAFSRLDDLSTNYAIARDEFQDTQGSTITRWNPAIDYVVSERVRVSLFYERTVVEPKVSTSYKRTDWKGGLKINFTLTP